ncbi:hypothetical protein KY312_04515 [Candidatus Woesearchaeota archaeon]|nr:hypothetical protein [Candidatus Woesearchaeota archaeon]
MKLKNTIYTGLAAIVASFAFSYGAKAQEAPPVKPVKIEINKKTGKVKTNVKYIDDGLNYNELSAASMHCPEVLNKEALERLKGKVLTNFGYGEEVGKGMDAEVKKWIVYDLVIDSATTKTGKFPLEYFQKLVNAVHAAMEPILGKPETKPTETPPKTTTEGPPTGEPALSTLKKTEGKNNLEYQLEESADGKRILVMFPVGINISPETDEKYCLNLKLRASGAEHASVEVEQEEGKPDKYKLLMQLKNLATPTAEYVSLKKVQKWKSYMGALDNFFKKHKDEMMQDPKTGAMVFKDNYNKAKALADLRDDPKVSGYTHTRSEYKEILNDKRLSSSQKKYGKRILDELMKNFRPRKGWHHAKKTDAGVVHMPNSKAFAALEKYVTGKDPDCKDIRKAVENLEYEISFIPRGRPSFQVVVKDEGKYVGSWRQGLQNSGYLGKAEKVMEEILKATGHTD